MKCIRRNEEGKINNNCEKKDERKKRKRLRTMRMRMKVRGERREHEQTIEILIE